MLEQLWGVGMRVIGLISGTSADGIDAALVEIAGTRLDLTVEVVAAQTFAYPAKLRDEILSVCQGAAIALEQLAVLDDAIADQFAQAALAIQSNQDPASLVGSHGQTVFHRPASTQLAQQRHAIQQSSLLGYSLQLGRGDAIARITGLPTVSNFRAADIAVGGQGAPLVPPVDACLLSHPTRDRCVQNIGGISNVTVLPARKAALDAEPYFSQVRGWDTGPGNTLLDLAVQRFSNGKMSYDCNGAWAAQGTPCQDLVDQWLAYPFFQQPPPKSTGREEFGQIYLEQCLAHETMQALNSADQLATLTELTAASIVQNYQNFLPRTPDEVLICGGGGRNRYLIQRLEQLLDPTPVLPLSDAGLDGDFKEAIAFAVLAYWRLQRIPGNLPDATGAWQSVPLGDLYSSV